MDFQTGKVQKDPLKEQSIIEKYYNELYGQYQDRRMSEMTHATITIPQGTKMMVWNDHHAFVADTLTYLDAWKNRGDHYYRIPTGKELSVEHTSNKDNNLHVELVVWSTLMSHIIADRTGTDYKVMENQERYGLWVKMYETPTYIPQLDKTIVAYGVWEQDIPEQYNSSAGIIFNPLSPPGTARSLKRAYTSQNTNPPYNPAHIHNPPQSAFVNTAVKIRQMWNMITS